MMIIIIIKCIFFLFCYLSCSQRTNVNIESQRVNTRLVGLGATVYIRRSLSRWSSNWQRIRTLGRTLVSAALSICIGSDWTSWPQTTRYPLSMTSDECGSCHDSRAVMLLLMMMNVCSRLRGSRATAATDDHTHTHTDHPRALHQAPIPWESNGPDPTKFWLWGLLFTAVKEI